MKISDKTIGEVRDMRLRGEALREDVRDRQRIADEERMRIAAAYRRRAAAVAPSPYANVLLDLARELEEGLL